MQYGPKIEQNLNFLRYLRSCLFLNDVVLDLKFLKKKVEIFHFLAGVVGFWKVSIRRSIAEDLQYYELG